MSTPREPSMEDILASIKRVIAEEKEIRASAPPGAGQAAEDDAALAGAMPQAAVIEDDVLELDELAAEPAPAPAASLAPAPAPAPMPAPAPASPLVDDTVAQASRAALASLASMAATPPAPTTPASSGNPVEDMVREMLRPLLKQWLDDHLPRIVDEHVKREINRITGR